MKAQLWCRTTAADGKMRQDKLFKLRPPQLRGKGAPTLASSYSDLPESWTLPGWVVLPENLGPARLADKFTSLEKPATVVPIPQVAVRLLCYLLAARVSSWRRESFQISRLASNLAQVLWFSVNGRRAPFVTRARPRLSFPAFLKRDPPKEAKGRREKRGSH